MSTVPAKAFIAGFASTLVFHQGLLWLLYEGGFSPQAPWNIGPLTCALAVEAARFDR